MSSRTSGVAVAVNPPLVAFGQPEPALQVQIIPGHVHRVAADKQPRRPAIHELAQVLVERGYPAREPLLQRRELPPARGRPPGLRVQRGGDQADVLHLTPDLRTDRRYRLEPRVDTPREPAEAVVHRPPFFASRLRCKDCRTSLRASAIRSPGGCKGPP